ncbi:hypothetical protein Q604_UNBc4C00128G0002, partial [human gut metagenome]
VDLTENGKTEAVKRQNGSNYTVVFTINADVPPPILRFQKKWIVNW